MIDTHYIEKANYQSLHSAHALMEAFVLGQVLLLSFLLGYNFWRVRSLNQTKL